MATVTFLGACGTVTGSATHLAWGKTQALVDCGLFQGPEDLERLNWEPLTSDPSALSAVILTHAHLDHTGRLPRLTSRGYDGPIFCTKASRGLISLVLQDAGALQEEAARYAVKQGYSRHQPPRPLYTTKDVKRTLSQLTPIPFDEEREILPGIHLRYVRAGHLLGAASVEIRAKGSDGQFRRWLFSGDLGRYGVPILKDPQTPDEPPDALVLESTYGDRRHVREDAQEALAAVIRQTFARGGKVLIPAFALGRTQEVLFHLSALVDRGEIEADRVFLDSPMAIKASELYHRAAAEHDDELLELARRELDPLDPDRFHRCRSVDESKALNSHSEPAVIVAASGMATGGRIVHHLLHHLGDRRSSVVFVGYQAAGTRGRALVNGAEAVAIHGHRIPVRADISYLPMLSAHADCDELLRWCRSLPVPPRRVFLNHGEDPQRKALAAALTDELSWASAVLPVSGDRVPW